MMSSDSEGDDVDTSLLQQQLLDRLDSYVEDMIGEEKSKKKNKKRQSMAQSDSSVTPSQQKVGTKNTNQAHSDNSDINFSGRKTLVKDSTPNISKIKAFTSAAKLEKLQSASVKIKQQKHSIKAKVKEIFEYKPKTANISENDNEVLKDNISENASENSDFEEEFPEDDSFWDNSDLLGSDDDTKNDVNLKDSKQKHLDKFKSALGITEEDLLRARQEKERLAAEKNKEPGRVVTIGSLKGNMKNRAPPEVIVFGRDRKAAKEPKKTKKKKVDESPDEAEEGDEVEFDLHRARHEVRKFGIHGLEGSHKEAGMVDLLVGLGAAPPKREKINYKELQKKRKHDKEEALQKRTQDRSFGFKVVNPNKRKHKRERDKNDVGISDGQIGSYRDGVQMVGKRHIEKVTRKKRRK